MTAGPRPFVLREGTLVLELRPILPAWLFDENGTFTFRFLRGCEITYHNPQRQDTFASLPRRFVLYPYQGETLTVEGDSIPAPYAAQVRDGQIRAMEVFL